MGIRHATMIIALALPLLGLAACDSSTGGTPSAADATAKPSRPSNQPSRPPTSSTTRAADQGDAVTIEQPKRVDERPECSTLLPPATAGEVVGAPTTEKNSDEETCRFEYANADLSQSGVIVASFSLISRDGATQQDFSGNTAIEKKLGDQTCEFAVAINADKSESDLGSWLAIRVTNYGQSGDPCDLAGRLTKPAFDNLPDA
jgi:hypothetical protein